MRKYRPLTRPCGVVMLDVFVSILRCIVSHFDEAIFKVSALLVLVVSLFLVNQYLFRLKYGQPGRTKLW